MALKEYYESFKEELSDSDFSDCEILEEEINNRSETHGEETESQDEDNQEEETFEVVVVASEDDLRKIRNRKAVLAIRNNYMQQKVTQIKKEKIQDDSSGNTRRNRFSRDIENKVKKTGKRSFLFNCNRCGKGFSQRSHWNNHGQTQCDRQLVFNQRQVAQNKIKQC